MGFSLSWLAIRGKSREEIHQELSITPTGTYEEDRASPCNGAHLTGGWYLVVQDHLGVFSDEQQLARLSLNGEAITCFVEEHVMVSEATGWRDGRKIWSVLHDSQKGIGHLDAQGDLPSGYDSIRAGLEAKQAADDDGDVDYIFDVPVEIAWSVAGYRHDVDSDTVDQLGFEVLHIAEPPKKRWFQRLFRKN